MRRLPLPVKILIGMALVLAEILIGTMIGISQYVQFVQVLHN
jgi:hypothetical protein